MLMRAPASLMPASALRSAPVEGRQLHALKLVGIAQPSVRGYSDAAIRLADKARSAGVSS